MEQLNKVDLANAQFIGYFHGREHDSVISLVISMNLTEDEWEELKNKYALSLTDNDIKRIDRYFEFKKKG